MEEDSRNRVPLHLPARQPSRHPRQRAVSSRGRDWGGWKPDGTWGTKGLGSRCVRTSSRELEKAGLCVSRASNPWHVFLCSFRLYLQRKKYQEFQDGDKRALNRAQGLSEHGALGTCMGCRPGCQSYPRAFSRTHPSLSLINFPLCTGECSTSLQAH